MSLFRRTMVLMVLVWRFAKPYVIQMAADMATDLAAGKRSKKAR